MGANASVGIGKTFKLKHDDASVVTVPGPCLTYHTPGPWGSLLQILPDLKWDRHTLSSLYLIAIVQDRSLRSLRDLRPSGDKDDAHIQLLKKIRDAATKVAKDTYGLEGGPGGALRCFVHYQPTY